MEDIKFKQLKIVEKFINNFIIFIYIQKSNLHPKLQIN